MHAGPWRTSCQSSLFYRWRKWALGQQTVKQHRVENHMGGGAGSLTARTRREVWGDVRVIGFYGLQNDRKQAHSCSPVLSPFICESYSTKLRAAIRKPLDKYITQVLPCPKPKACFWNQQGFLASHIHKDRHRQIRSNTSKTKFPMHHLYTRR